MRHTCWCHFSSNVLSFRLFDGRWGYHFDRWLPPPSPLPHRPPLPRYLTFTQLSSPSLIVSWSALCYIISICSFLPFKSLYFAIEFLLVKRNWRIQSIPYLSLTYLSLISPSPLIANALLDSWIIYFSISQMSSISHCFSLVHIIFWYWCISSIRYAKACDK